MPAGADAVKLTRILKRPFLLTFGRLALRIVASRTVGFVTVGGGVVPSAAGGVTTGGGAGAFGSAPTSNA